MPVKIFQISVAVLSTLLLLVLLWKPSAPDTLDRLEQTGSLRIGYSAQYPYVYVNEYARVAGTSADAARHITQQLNIKQIEWIAIPSEQLLSSLQAGHIDVIAAAMNPDSWPHNVQTSLPTLQVFPGVLYTADNPAPVQSDTHVKLGIIEASVAGQTILPIQSDNVAVFADIYQALDALDTRQIDGIVSVEPELRPLADSYPDDYKLLTLALPPAQLSFAFRQGDQRLATAWNTALKNWLSSEAHLSSLHQHGFQRHNLPAPAAE